MKTAYSFGRTVRLGFDETVARIRDALAREGFGILTEIDVRATFRKKLDVDFRPYLILGACNPPLARQALETDLDIGVLLPCNVVVRAGDDPDTTVVSAMDPLAALSLAGDDAIEAVARDVRERIDRALAAIA